MEFESYLHPEFIKLIERIHLQGFKVGVTGGTVRDFLLNRKSRHDYDCELRLVQTTGDIEHLFSTLDFQSEYKIKHFPYNILKIDHGEFSCELSLPRIEEYNDEFSHSNFTARFYNDLDYDEAFKRRDFTINAMMYEFNGSWQFIDPLNGKKDLGDKLLRPCSEAFFMDPVRYLRAIRFRNILEFSIDEAILKAFEEIEIEDFSAHYLREEAIKSKKAVSFILDIFELMGEPIIGEYNEYIRGVEKNIVEIKNHLSSLLFLEAPLREFLFELFDYSFKVEEFHFPLSFEQLSESNLDEFKSNLFNKKILITIKKLAMLDQKYYGYIFDLSLVDLDFEAFSRLQSIQVDLSSIENKEKQNYQIYKKIESYFKNE